MYSVSFFQRIPYNIGGRSVFCFRLDVLSPKRISLGLADSYYGTDIVMHYGHVRRCSCENATDRPHLTRYARNINSQLAKWTDVFVVYLIFVPTRVIISPVGRRCTGILVYCTPWNPTAVTISGFRLSALRGAVYI